ncbi:MAG: hypothetical protein OEW45_08190 [Deltaproteobacteria bacterium]|nr:hypothetical protein [Deltaproteobacteria bacterium]
MVPLLRNAFFALGLLFLVQVSFSSDLQAFSVAETKIFREGSYTLKMEIQVSGPGKLRKNPVQLSSLKVKIKNERASSQVLKVKTIRAYREPKVYKDIEIREYSISPGQWVTKYFRLPKGKKPFLSDQGFIEIVFENFTIQFSPRKRKFQGPLK